MASPIKSILVLEDRMTPALTKAQRQAIANAQAYQQMDRELIKMREQMDLLAQAGLKNTTTFQNLKNAFNNLVSEQEKYANGTKNAKIANEDFKNSSNDVVSALQRQVQQMLTWAALIRGTKKLMDMSDVYTQTNARLGLMTDNVQHLNDLIYASAQSSRVSLQSMSDIVAKIGNQAGDAFDNNSAQVVKFSELLNKMFATQGMDDSQISSTMYNLTQSLASGKLLGPDYRILKMQAPQMIKYLEQFYGVNRAGLDEMVSKGQVTAKALRNAIFSASEDIEEKFEKMPVTFSQVWTKFSNTLTRVLQPVLEILSKVADWLDGIVTFLSEHQYILYIIGGAILAMVAAWAVYNVVTAISNFVTAMLSGSLNMVAIKAVLLAVVIIALVTVLLYLWNTNDEASYYILLAWDSLYLGFKSIVLGLKMMWYGLLTVIEHVCIVILQVIDNVINAILEPINLAIDAINFLSGKNLSHVGTHLAEKAGITEKARTDARAKDLTTDALEIVNKTNELNSTRDQRVKDRKKIGLSTIGADASAELTQAMKNVNLDDLGNVIGSDGSGGKALKTTSNDKLIDDDDIQLLLDLATRDYKLNYQQVTPQITMTFGDIRETADVDIIAEQFADRLEEIIDGNLEVVRV